MGLLIPPDRPHTQNLCLAFYKLLPVLLYICDLLLIRTNILLEKEVVRLYFHSWMRCMLEHLLPCICWSWFNAFTTSLYCLFLLSSSSRRRKILQHFRISDLDSTVHLLWHGACLANAVDYMGNRKTFLTGNLVLLCS